MKQKIRLSIIVFSIVVICMSTVLFVACNREDQSESEFCTIEYIAQEGGRIVGTNTQSIEYGASGIRVIAMPATGYEFVRWSDGSTDNARVESNVTGNKTFTAIFRKKPYTVEYISQAGGSITGTRIQQVEHGANGTQVIAVPDTGYEFVKWSDGNTDSARIDNNVTESKVFTAIFRESLNFCTIEYIAQSGGMITGTRIQQVERGANGTQVIAVSDTGYEFVKWSDGNTESMRFECNVTESKKYTAEFRKKTFTIEYIAQEGGSLSGNTVQTISYNGVGTYVTAVPQTGYEFVRWSDGETFIHHLSLNTRENRRITAEFRKKIYTLRYGADINGKLIGDTDQAVEYLGSGTSITAVPVDSVVYEFDRWSDGVTTATRTDVNVTNNKDVIANFKKRTFTVRYGINNHYLGELIDLDDPTLKFTATLPFTVQYGESAPRIFASSKQNIYGEDYEFLYWSDGSTERERNDTDITSDMTFIAYYGYKIDYIVNDNVGGKIEGNTAQIVMPNELGEYVKAVANDGYVFMGWSDLSWNRIRQDDPNYKTDSFGIEYSYHRNLKITAYFEPIKKTFAYDYGYEFHSPLSATQITLDRNAIEEAEFAVPVREGYHFCGWYADSDYKTRITTDTGRYMYGYASFSLKSDTLYARWEKEDERTDNHKILMVFTDKVQATLYSKHADKDIKVNTVMTAIDYRFCDSTATIMSNLLNEWFEGKVIFEVDSYYTTETVTDGFRCIDGGHQYHLMPQNINEISDVNYLYHNTLAVVGFGDFDGNLIGNLAGMADIKNAYVAKDRELWKLRHYILYQNYLEDRNNGKIDLDQTIINTCLHELIHTAEMYFPREDNLDLHDAISYANRNFLDGTTILNTLKPCLLGEFEMNGDKFCVPMKYWEHNMTIHIQYVERPVDMKDAGTIRVIGDDGSSGRYVPYGSNFSVEAVPKPGYRFVGWSDGVTTAVRCDKNIIAAYRIEAIFEKI